MRARRRRRRSARVLITGHTGSEGGAVDAHLEPGMGTPGQYEGPMDGRLSGYAEELARRQTDKSDDEDAGRVGDDQG